MIRISLRNDTTGCNQSDRCFGEILYRRVRSNSVERRHRVFCLKWLVSKFLKKHLNRTFGSSFFFEEVHTYTVRHIPLLTGSTDCFMLCKFQSKWRHTSNCFSHTCCRVLGRHGVDFVLKHICARVLCIHTCYCRNAKLFLYSITDRTTGNAVTSGIKCRTCHEHIRIVFLYNFQNFCFCFIKIFIEVGVATDNSSYDFCLFSKCLFECKTRSDDFGFANFYRIVCFFFSTDISEELIDIMNYF